MMARRLKPTSERLGLRDPELEHDPCSILARTKKLLVKARPELVPSATRASIFDRLSSAAAASSAGVGTGEAPIPPQLYNRVVCIDGEEGYKFWYVLTYLPDLQWCHVAPLEKRGKFGERRGVTGHLASGRPRWMLVSEEEGGEIDVGAGRCHIMRAVEMKKTPENADEEEWDIIGPEEPSN
mmetsp:Transcript_65482/g.129697  ORF Transcript_65482/g.129697 Transcript_65482/m.129697 type:complete len:182 (-) Transcript_65482:269-814(-)